jgi:secondary thiamine-phosphate synthase enzyme
MPKGARVATVDAGESAPELPAESPPKMSPDGNENPYDHSENFENMHIAQTRLSIATASREIKEITADVAEWIECQGVSVGLLTLYIPHTSASLLIQENASPDVRRDVGAFLHRIVPENIALYRHNDEGPDDMPAHIKSALTQTQLSIPVTDGRLQLGTWQGIFLLEHRASPHCRALILTLIGEEEEPARRSGERHCSG